MINFIDGVFFFYMFLGLYMLSLLILIYFPNRFKMFEYPKGFNEGVSIVMPCYNEGKTIGLAIDSLLKLDYPKEMIEIIIVDDKSTDNSVKEIKKYEKIYSNIRLIVNERNSGGAAEPTNLGIKAAKFDYIAVADADSVPDKDCLKKMIGFLQKDNSVGGVTCAVMVRNPKTFMQKLQSIEYASISFSRKLLDLIDSVYVTPGPFALYRKKILLEIGLFDKKNLTQDIEIVWRMQSYGYKARMCLAARVYSEAPNKFKDWLKQRIRWNIGGTQTLIKYKKFVFRKGMLGAFIVPFFSISLFIGLFGLGLFSYLLSQRILVNFLATKYSLYAETAILRFQELSFAPSILNFFGATLFLLGLFFTLFGLGIMRELKQKHTNIFNISFYLLIYLAIYPFIMVISLYKLARGNYSW
ncbi:TPA: glycosyltransferase family 2 protein [Candidatus Pacearchaeota archaeon]|nr:glycosyltransferase family 2 protein [Candidatus Pacearchaeota archaeon]